MITNASLTIYHKGFDENTRLETYTRYNYSNVWYFGGKGTSLNEGLTEKNDVQIRIPYDTNLDISHFAVGDIIVKGTLEIDIQTQQDLSEYEIFNIIGLNYFTFQKLLHIFQ